MTGVASAGHPFEGVLGPLAAARILTGAVIPTGANTVVADEECDRDGETLHVRIDPRLGRNILARAAHTWRPEPCS